MSRLPSLGDIPPAAQAEIARRLEAIRKELGVRILLAVESGSRAWGFPSPDSDFDVRFIYARPLPDYVALNEPRDVIETPIERDMDVNGWDLRKAMRLGLSGNAIVTEWLSSPIVYLEDESAAPKLRALFAQPVSSPELIRHYLGLARRQWASIFGSRQSVRLKKYFYVIRPALALAWLRDRPGQTPPMTLPLLLEGADLPETVARHVLALRDLKSRADEAAEGQRIPDLDDWIDLQFSWARTALAADPPGRFERRALDAEALFKEIVARA